MTVALGKPPGKPVPPPIWPLYRAMVGVGLACALLIVVVHQTTAETIADNRAEALERAIFEVLPDTVRTRPFRLDGVEFVPTEGAFEGEQVHAGYRDDGSLVGVAIEGTAMGYQDTIRALYGYSIDLDAIVGFRVLESRETPGLGDRIETEESFRANFERLDVSLNEGGSAPRNPIVAVAEGGKSAPWQIDGLSGATISSVAVANLLRSSTERWVPLLEQQHEVFERGSR